LIIATALATRSARAEGGGADAQDRALAGEARLDVILAAVNERNPELREASARAEAGEARAAAAARLPDLELKGELWAVPLARPLAFGEANTIMVGLRQAFPAWGSLDARGRLAREEAAAAGDGARARRQALIADARRAYAAFFRAEREHRIHLEHVGLTSQLLEVARARYAVGGGTQQDLLRLQSELSRLHVDVATIDQQHRSAQALLNALMARPPDAALGPPPDVDVTALLAAAGDEAAARDAELHLADRRPELQAAARAVRRGEAALDLARREADLPTVMVGADYWYMPTFSVHHAYGAMVAVSLPWLNPRHRDEVHGAERAAVADRSALEAQQAAARYQLHDAAARVEAARQTLLIVHERVLPDARRSFESARALFQTGQGDVTPVLDAARAYLQVRIDEARAIADLESSRAELARAAGSSP
jgi:outer membrane protein TolC